MNAASISLPIVPIIGSLSSSFLPTDVKLSLDQLSGDDRVNLVTVVEDKHRGSLRG